MKIYAVTAGNYSDYHIITLTTNVNKARYIAKLFNDKNSYSYAFVEEYEDLNINEGENIYTVELLDEKTGLSVRRIKDDKNVFFDLRQQPPYITYTPYLNLYCVTLFAKDEETAKKIAYDEIRNYYI